jgi:hypothetical protein
MISLHHSPGFCALRLKLGGSTKQCYNFSAFLSLELLHALEYDELSSSCIKSIVLYQVCFFTTCAPCLTLPVLLCDLFYCM